MIRALILGLLLCFTMPALADPFGAPANAPEKPEPTAPVETAGPTLFGGFVQNLARAQSRINDRISHEIRTVRDTGSLPALIGIMGLAFLWGVLHAAGPGHGKSLVAAYFATTEARWTSGIVMGGVISLLQGLTAIITVLILAAILHELQSQVALKGAVIEVVSYGLVVALGLVMLWRAATGQGHAHHHGPIGAPGHGHDDHDHHHDHDHGHGHGHEHSRHDHHRHGEEPTVETAAPIGRRKFSFSSILTVFAGVAPCASAIIIMLFALANDAVLIGTVAVLALSLGMGLTVSAIGVMTILARRFMTRFAGGSTARGEAIERVLAIAGSLAVIGFSGLLLLGAWYRLGEPV
jgi:ABC-type nickel/cobalt efflux system permease component RcnA